MRHLLHQIGFWKPGRLKRGCPRPQAQTGSLTSIAPSGSPGQLVHHLAACPGRAWVGRERWHSQYFALL